MAVVLIQSLLGSTLLMVDTVTVSNDTNSVSFNYSDENSLNTSIELLSKLGYPVEGEQNSLSKKAKSYMSCAVGRMSK